MRNVHAWLTGICALLLVGSFLPGLGWLAYASVAAGSTFALRSAYQSVRDREIDVNLLMVLAAIGAVAVGQVRDAAALLFLFALSNTLERLAMSKTRSAIEGLIALRPDRATLVTPTGDQSIAVGALKVGDRIRVSPFETVPVDSAVEEGSGTVNQSAMTGESVPVARSVGDLLIGGTQNLEGMLIARVSAASGETTLDKIVALVQNAQANKASGERVSQWFGQRYTVFVLAAFAVSFIFRVLVGEPSTVALAESLTLLVALSPCALVISTPAATLSALTWAARHGILIRGGEFIERAATVTALACDKTGTLTTGKPSLVEICVCSPVAAGEVCRKADQCWSEGRTMADAARVMLRYAAAAEQYASHPIAAAIVRAARYQGLDVPEAAQQQSHSGLGVSAVVDGHQVRIGQPRFFGDDLPGTFVEHAKEFQRRGLTVALLQVDQEFAALGLLDTPRPEAKAFLKELETLGVHRVAMMTGDHQVTGEAIGKELGIAEVHAGLLPQGKEALLREMASGGHQVMMVGDGVNDAPALAAASVGVAMGGLGSDIALNAADIVLMNDRLMAIPETIRLGRRTRGTIRANLIFAAGMIIVLTAASVVGVLPLWTAVLGHEGSTVLVILNGLRLLSGSGFQPEAR